MEYAENGDLAELIKVQREKKKYLSERDIWNFAYEICLGVKYG